MNHSLEDTQHDVFKERLAHLRREGYLSEETYRTVMDASVKYLHDRRVERENKEDVRVDPPVPVQEKPSPAVKKPEPVRKSKEEVRERNITWSLILGVALLLITGLIVATSQWDQMGAGMKVFSIAFVSLFFYSLSYGTQRFLKIEKTAFAFLTLGSLLIPIAVVAIGYFELFGSFLSLTGEGRYLLGFLGAFLPLPLYVKHAFDHQSRLYVWISLVFLSLTVGFALGALPLSIDVFYTFLMVFNAGLLVIYTKYGTFDKWRLFTKELPLYAQLNLILSTMLLLFFFENEVLYSFNLLLTACIYMAMVFVYRTKEYQFVFSVMFVYAVYQLVDHTPLQAVDGVVYAVAGGVYLGFAYAFRNHDFIQKVFRYTSAVVSFCAFLYISYESVLLREGESSWMFAAAYLVVAGNYLVLANLLRYPLFSYMAPVFFYVGLWQVWEQIAVFPLFLELFLTAVVTLLYVGLWTKQPWLQSVKESSLVVSAVLMAGTICYSFYELLYGYSAFQLFVVGCLAYVVKWKQSAESVEKAVVWIQPASWLAASGALYLKVIEWVPGYADTFGVPFHLALTGVLLCLLHLFWKRIGENGLSKASFNIGQGAYIFGIIFLGTADVDRMFIAPLILLGGTAMLYWLIRSTGQSSLWIAVSIVTLFFYFSLAEPLSLESFASLLIFTAFAPVVMVALGEFGRTKWEGMQPNFYWTGHAVHPLVILACLFDQVTPEPAVHPILLVVPAAVYLFSAWKAEREWEIKLMLYFGMSVVFLFLFTLGSYYSLYEDVFSGYTFMVASALFLGAWAVLPLVWKSRLEWYWIPFSILGLLYFTVFRQTWAPWEFLLPLAYAVSILYFLHRRNWSIVRFAPLLILVDLLENQAWDRGVKIVVVLGCVALLLAAGKKFHRMLVGSNYEVDAYSFSALVYLLFLNGLSFSDDSVWIRILPLLALTAWLWVNASKWMGRNADRISYTAGAGSLYASYLLILLAYETSIPDIFMAELQVLPLLVVLALMRKKLWSDAPGVMNKIQFAAVLLVAAYLVVDAIKSHTIWDAWIIGGLSLLSMVAGMQFKIKSYFFVGMGVLIFNVLYQTKPYWGNVPWWVYLLMAGLVLIAVASYNEWQKQQEGKDRPIERKLKGLWHALKKWN
ncbi:hypothetical protein [Halobacillus sp. KGW1]|uniref:hypothetical protein n=1 Tax=Halobacillus sp. KGW1 TaxID=1793726 RepID=UPI00078549E9|nr:hypothetical protein [Halobacillus sp. KGW1]